MNVKNKKVILILISISMMIFISSCSSSDTGSNNAMEAPSAPLEERFGSENQKSSVSEQYGDGEVAYDQATGVTSLTNFNDPSLKIIKNGSLNIETKELNNALTMVTNKVMSLNGYVQSLNSDNKTRISLVVRIPSENFDNFMNESSEFGNILSKNISTDDISDVYFDTEAHIKSLKLQEERLLDLLSKGTELKYLLEVENELARVRYEIEKLEGSMRQYDNRISLSTVEIYIYETYDYTEEKNVPRTFGAKLLSNIADGANVVKTFLENLILALTYLLPILALLACIGFVVLKLVKWLKKKKILAKKSDSEDKDTKNIE